MMVLDLNNVLFSSVLYYLSQQKEKDIEQNMVSHIAINTIRSINVKFKNEYGDLVVAADSLRYWRKQYFPYYKASRKKAREQSDINWTKLFECLGVIKTDLKESFPYKYIDIEGAEADDIIAVAASKANSPMLIISSDKDFVQLQVNSNVRQYDPVNKKFISNENPKGYLFEHVIKGDVGDGIPNIASSDNCFVVGERQKKVTQNLLLSLEQIDKTPEHPLYRNYMRNKTLIDLTQIPEDLKSKITTELDTPNSKDRSKLWPYFTKNQMVNLISNINDF